MTLADTSQDERAWFEAATTAAGTPRNAGSPDGRTAAKELSMRIGRRGRAEPEPQIMPPSAYPVADQGPEPRLNDFVAATGESSPRRNLAAVGSYRGDKVAEMVATTYREVAELKSTVAAFEAFFAITLIAKLDTIVGERLSALERPTKRLSRTRGLLVLSLVINFAFAAILLFPELRDTAALVGGDAANAILKGWFWLQGLAAGPVIDSFAL